MKLSPDHYLPFDEDLDLQRTGYLSIPTDYVPEVYPTTEAS